MEINWQIFGSNGQEKADYSRGVLERFTRRAFNNSDSNPMCKTIVNARRVNFFHTPHCAAYFEGAYALKPNGEVQRTPQLIRPPLTDKIVINHYHCKSWEEYQLKNKRGDVFYDNKEKYTRELFNGHDLNDEFDDEILRYRELRAKVYQPPDKSQVVERLFYALTKNISPTFLSVPPPNFYAGKLETFLTCRAVASYLQTKLDDDAPAKFFEEASLKAILKSLATGASLADLRLLLSELPNLLVLQYPVVGELRGACLQILPKMMEVMHLNNRWMDFVELDYIKRLLQT